MALQPTEPQTLELLHAVRLDRIATKLSMPLEYGQFASDVLLKAHLLPYLLPIKSERELAFAIAEKDVLRCSIGLTGNSSPARGTLWHFRKRNLPLFRRLLVRGLSIIYLEAAARNIDVPFVEANGCGGESTGIPDVFEDQIFKVRIEIGSPPPSKLVTSNEQLVLPLEIRGKDFISVAPRVLLPNEIGFPLRVIFRHPSRDTCVVFRQPFWLDQPYRPTFEVGSHFGRTKKPYTACNVVVARSVGGRDQILLSKRLQGSGAGSYTLPGGKKHENESVKACVKRELEEETGLILVEARPISVRTTNMPGYPRVRSIGVLATTRGEPRRRERYQHSEWDWYDLTDLPSPLFFPTEFVLEDFRERGAGDLTWDDVEDSDSLPLWRQK